MEVKLYYSPSGMVPYDGLEDDVAYVLYTDHQAVVAELEGKLEVANKDQRGAWRASNELEAAHAAERTALRKQLQQATEREAALLDRIEYLKAVLSSLGWPVATEAALAHNPKG